MSTTFHRYLFRFFFIHQFTFQIIEKLLAKQKEFNKKRKQIALKKNKKNERIKFDSRFIMIYNPLYSLFYNGILALSLQFGKQCKTCGFELQIPKVLHQLLNQKLQQTIRPLAKTVNENPVIETRN